MYYVYILICADNSYYVGHTTNLTRRIQAHHAGTAARFTRDRSPVRLVYAEDHPTHLSALDRERQLKRWTRAKKEALMRGDRDTLRRLSKRRGN